MLPKFIHQERTDKNFLVGYTTEDGTHIEKSNTEADARAKMLIYLLEKKMIEL